MADVAELKKLLHESSYDNQKEFLDNFSGIFKAKNYSLPDASQGIFYSTSHSLVQSALAAEKMRRCNERAEEPGEKCQMCGEFEVLHTIPWKEGQSADDYGRHLKRFWADLKERAAKRCRCQGERRTLFHLQREAIPAADSEKE